MSGIPSPSPVRYGSVSIVSRGIDRVGNDEDYDFKRRIFLQNGDPLRIDPNDLICHVRVLEQGKDEGRYTYLPSSLFDQARVPTDKGDSILCRIEDKVYQLLLVPTIHSSRDNRFDAQRISFDTIMGTMRKNSKNIILGDAPDGDQSIYRSSVFHSLSREVKRIYLEKTGAVPFAFNELKLVDLKIPVHPMDVWEPSADENGITFTLLAYDYTGNGFEPYFEILLDGNHLLVTMEAKVGSMEEQEEKSASVFYTTDLCKEGEDSTVEEVPTDFPYQCYSFLPKAEKALSLLREASTDFPYQRCSFCEKIILSGSRKIDPDKITVVFRDGYKLIFNIPYQTK